MKNPQSIRGNPNTQIAVGVIWLLLALGQLAVNWEKIVWNLPLFLVLGFSNLGLFHVLTGLEAKFRERKDSNEKNQP